MNERIKALAEQVGMEPEEETEGIIWWLSNSDLEKFVELIKQAIYNDVKEELIDDAIINEEPDSVSREYLKGCNGGIVDALCHIKNFGLEIEL